MLRIRSYLTRSQLSSGVRWLPTILQDTPVAEGIARLLETIEAASSLLRRYGVEFWAKWLADDATRIRSRDFQGLEHLLSAYGGMGSLNDVYICPENGHPVAAEDVAAVNKQLQHLLSRIFKLAERLRREEAEAWR